MNKRASLSFLALNVIVITALVLANTHSSANQWNDFKLDRLTVPKSAIYHGGPPRDGIPSIDSPTFIAASKNTFLDPDELVLGINFKGVQRAFPIKILNYHEIVNMLIGNHSVSVTWCPLCGSGIAFINPTRNTQFGVSGLLYKSDMLMYDRETNSLWSQILGQAISGPRSGERIQAYPLQRMPWKSWLKIYPDTELLSIKTGFKRNYNRHPYGRYDENTSIYFPVGKLDPRYHPKERVLAIEINNKFKAWPFSELGKTGQTTIQDNFAGKQLTLNFDSTTRSGEILDSKGKALPAINLFWFAWIAFHPNSEVWTAPTQGKDQN